MNSIVTQFLTVLVPTLVFAAGFYLASRLTGRFTFRWALPFKAVLSLVFLYYGFWGHFFAADAVVSLIPGFIPFPYFWSYASGLVELLFVFGLWWPRFEKLTGATIIAFLVLVLPFNIYGWTVPGNVPNFENSPWYLWGRIPMQAVFIAFAYYGTGLDRLVRDRRRAG